MNDYYTLLGIRRLINASGTLTSLGGSKIRPRAARAMAEAGGCFVDLAELHLKAGRYVAELIGVKAACITAGAAAGLTQAVAACMAGGDALIRARLPQKTPKYEVIIQCCHRNPFERALQLAGAELVQVGDAIHTMPFELEGAITDRTAAIVHFLQADMLEASLTLRRVLEIALRYQVPVIVDAAAELPPKRNLWELAQQGADLVVFSGGKDIRGPQASGLIVGRPDLIQAAMLQAAPHEYAIARPMKASKETVIGLVCALEEYLQEDEARRFEVWEDNCRRLEAQIGRINGLQVRRYQPATPRIQPPGIPRLELRLEPSAKMTVSELAQRLRQGNPAIAVDMGHEAIYIHLHTLNEEEVEIVGRRIGEILE